MSRPDFDALYARDPDPWSFATSPYEHAKYTATLTALGGRRFAHGLEIGCSIGVLTQRLAGHCAALLAVDVAEAAVRQARSRCAALPQVRFARMEAPEQWPPGRFDLIVLSEVLYFLDAARIARCAERAMAATGPGAVVLLVNWLGENAQPVDGPAAAALFMAACGDRAALRLRTGTADYRIDRLERV
jgi:cyclopropane fatty-acyl-phospholipid synthase-like methyltransferase